MARVRARFGRAPTPASRAASVAPLHTSLAGSWRAVGSSQVPLSVQRQRAKEQLERLVYEVPSTSSPSSPSSLPEDTIRLAPRSPIVVPALPVSPSDQVSPSPTPRQTRSKMRAAPKVSGDLPHVSADMPPPKGPPRRKPFTLDSPRVDSDQITLFPEISPKKDASRQRPPIASRSAGAPSHKMFCVKCTKNMVGLKVPCDVSDKRCSRCSKAGKPCIPVRRCSLFSYVWLMTADKRGVSHPI